MLVRLGEDRLPAPRRKPSVLAVKAIDCYRRAYAAKTETRKRILLQRLDGYIRIMEPEDRASYYAGVRKLNV
jgi:hypothetical protein